MMTKIIFLIPLRLDIQLVSINYPNFKSNQLCINLTMKTKFLFFSLEYKNPVCLLIPAFLLFFTWSAKSQQDTVAGYPVNYDEAKTGTYTLPDLLVMQNGEKVTTAKMWMNKRRPEILHLYETEQFGKCPSRENTSFTVFDKGTPVFDNKVIRKQITLYFTEDTSKNKADVALYLPANVKKPVPVFLMINFTPNSLRIKDPGLKPGITCRAIV